MADWEGTPGSPEVADEMDMEEEYLFDNCAEDPFQSHSSDNASNFNDLIGNTEVMDFASDFADKMTDGPREGTCQRIGNNSSCSSSVDKVDSSEHDLFVCTLLVYKREFKGQTSGAYIARWELSANSRDDFLAKIWNLASEFLHREIIFESNTDGSTTPKWHSKEKPTMEDFNNFALFQSGRRYYKVENLQDVKHNLLRNWRDKEISLYLHIYSLSVSNRAVWSTVKEQLIDPSDQDRAGAASTQVVLELTEELRKLHGEYLEAHGMAWTFWANAIQSAPAYKRSSMMQYPPQTLAGLFAAKEGTRINAIKRKLETVNNDNNSCHEGIAALRKAFDTLRASMNTGINALNHRIERLELRELTSSNLLNAMKTSIVVHEDEIGENLRNHITDCPDVDHAE
ncbi:uncharacterized protein LOC134222057 [Armigeres subalbatus]|uniref:uncharacterized protein LOC134222057 n=1 Tax=Armigeres subalbatus TaxID=124917 RepID=UPI002ED4171B